MAADRATPTLAIHFLGVSTAGSSALRMFPVWMQALERPEVMLVGVDLPLHAPAWQYRHAVQAIRDDPQVAGGLVTTHKIDLFEATRDLFDDLDPYAGICGEVNTIAKSAGRLVGYATDPVAGGVCLGQMLGAGYFARTGGHVLCLGAGGAGTAIALYLAHLAAPDRPACLVIVDRLPQRLSRVRTILESQDSDMDVHYCLSESPAQNDALLATLPAGSVIVNATGMGKDRPGSPLTGAALFPERAVVWELNYRGELAFLHHARAQQVSRRLAVHDGWDYFVSGWATVLTHILQLKISGQTHTELAALAAAVR